MPTSEAPSSVSQSEETPEVDAELHSAPDVVSHRNGAEGLSLRGASRWVDYDTHELLERIGELEDERRWARLREGTLWAVLFHILVILAIILIPKYVLKMRPAIETANIQNHKDFTYLDTPFLPKPRPVKPLAEMPRIDRKTLEMLKRESETPKPAPPAAVQPKPPVEQKPQPAPPVPSTPKPQPQVEAPRPRVAPAQPNFAQLERSPAAQLQQEMRNAMRGGSTAGAQMPAEGLPMHPGAGNGGVQILSDTQGVDFSRWLAAWYYETRRTWDPLIPDEVNPPISKQGQVLIRFKVLPNGRVMEGSMVLDGRSGDTGLDRAAWGAITGSSYPPLPKDFHGPYIELRAWFLYNMQPPQQ